MKCPKCGYLGFDSGDRCKNCGYEFALLGREQSGLVVTDPGLARGSKYRKTPGPGQASGLDRRLTPSPEGTPIDLPLFGDGPVPPPRPPIAVRRPTPTPARLRARAMPAPRPVELSLNLEAPAPTPAPVLATAPPEASHADAVTPVQNPAALRGEPAPAWRRLVAASLDLAIVAGIDAAILWFTLRLCGLNASEARVLPLLPLIAFFALFNGGYVLLFTGTLGKTLGKMAVGIEVVSSADGPMDLKRAAVRVFAIALSVAPAGLGLLPAAFGVARPLHDWMAGTQVIRTPA